MFIKLKNYTICTDNIDVYRTTVNFDHKIFELRIWRKSDLNTFGIKFDSI